MYFTWGSCGLKNTDKKHFVQFIYIIYVYWTIVMPFLSIEVVDLFLPI